MARTKSMSLEADRRFPVRIRIAIPADGLGTRLNDMRRWLDDNCGANGWATAPAGMRGVLNDALAVYFESAALAAAFVARWCAVERVAVSDGVFVIRSDAPEARVPSPPHRTP